MRTAFLLGLLLAPVATAAAGPFTPPDQFLVDKAATVVAVVEVETIETRWAVIEHGDHMPFLRVTSRPLQVIAGPAWKASERLVTAHYDYSEMLVAPISPPPVVGREYLLFAEPVEPGAGDWVDRLEVELLAHHQGAHLLRGAGDDRWIHWGGARHLLRDIVERLAAGAPLLLAEIADPEKRRRIAEERLEGDAVGEPRAFAAAIAALIHADATFEDWYESLGLLRRAARHPDLTAAVVEVLTPYLDDRDPHKRRAVAIVLAELGEDGSAEVLRQTLAAAEVDLAADPEGRMSLPNRLPYDDSSVAAAAWALGRLGDRTGLGHEDVDVRLAAAGGLSEAGAEGLHEVLLPIAEALERDVEILRRKGELSAPRERGDYLQRYPFQWIRVHQLLSRLGDDASLLLLVEAVRIDRDTYPEAERSAFPQLEVARWTSNRFGWPGLGGALAEADPDRGALVARLEALLGAGDPIVAALQDDREAPEDRAATREEETRRERQETLRLIAAQLADDDPEVRARGLAGAGFERIDEHWERVLATALDGEGVEKRAARYGLSFYDREIPTEALHRLATEGDLDSRFTGVELATRSRPEAFAEDTLTFVRELLASESKDDFGLEMSKQFVPRILCRFSRSTIPAPILAALHDDDPAVAAAVAEGLGMGGNPDAIEALRAVAGEVREEPKAAAVWALSALGAE